MIHVLISKTLLVLMLVLLLRSCSPSSLMSTLILAILASQYAICIVPPGEYRAVFPLLKGIA